MSAARATNQKKTIDTFIDAWSRLSVEEMVAVRTPDCLQVTLPGATLQWPDATNEQFVAAMTPIFGSLKNFKPDVLSITNDGEAGRAVIHAKTAADAPWGPYRNEHVMVFSFNEDGSKITKVQDMADSAEVLKMMGQIAEFNSK